MKLNSPQFNLMYKACMKASRVLIRDFGEIEKLQVSEKGPGDFVTASDKRVEKIIIGELEKTDELMKNAFWIGVYPGINDEMRNYVLEVFDKFFKRF